MRDLLVIVPSRGRPENVAGLCDAWSGTDAEAELLVCVDDDDPALDGYRAIGCRLEVGPRIRLGPTLNRAATANADGYRALGFMGDDHRPRTLKWDRLWLDELDRLGTGLVYGDDLLQGEAMPTAVALTSDIVRALGWMCPPVLTHLCIDVAWLWLGLELGRITYLPDVVVEHMHPANGKAELDAGYLDVNSAAMKRKDSAAFQAWAAHDLLGDVARVRAACRL